ncbi:glutathione synthase [Ruminococcus flavefaciens]|uniref:Glutamate--cysteine ligase n=1 Tax=Ruminococcus flavefaciens TaxID=1265 RepID=A0A1K1PWJ0_RUMFL|nr:glutathione synthase [Ruminococcus flavefaciens]SFW51857.1 glutamate--cysteine ligase [Ruminococcus flavefaciens]
MTTSKYYYSGKFGIERETLRVDGQGRLAQTPHPFGNDEHITRDFCENQVELVTPVCHSVDEAVEALAELDKRTREELAKNGESIWLYSNPPHFDSEKDIPIADFTGDHSSKRAYREVLQQKYGKKLMLFSGIHFNFSFAEEFLRELNTNNEDFHTFRDEFYLRLYKQLMVHSWLLVLLTAASPYYDASLDKDGKSGIIMSEYSSLRNSKRGYWNKFLPILDHRSLKTFTGSIKKHIVTGSLYSASELYLPIRLKPKGVNTLENLAAKGVDHIELRMFDLNPSAALGIDSRDLEFAHLLILYLLSQADFDFAPELQEKSVRDHKNAALLEPDTKLLERGLEVIEEMEKHFSDNEKALEIIAFEKEKILGRNHFKTSIVSASAK